MTKLQSESNEPINVIGTKERKYLMTELGMNKYNLSMYIRHLKASKLLLNTTGKEYIVNPIFIPEFDETGQFTTTFIMNKEE